MNQVKRSIARRFITLIEIMIVMFIIALISGVIAYNYTGSLEEGKAFKTKTGIEKLQTILQLYIADHPAEIDHISDPTRWTQVVDSSPLVHDPDSLKRDGWGQFYQVSVEDGNITVSSQKYENYVRSHSTMFGNTPKGG